MFRLEYLLQLRFLTWIFFSDPYVLYRRITVQRSVKLILLPGQEVYTGQSFQWPEDHFSVTEANDQLYLYAFPLHSIEDSYCFRTVTLIINALM